MQINKDPILKRWHDNFVENYEAGLFSSIKVRPLNYLVNNNFYAKKPFILVAAGPSLDKNIMHLKEVQDKCIILCAEVILFKLMENGITPDYVVTIDPSEQFARFLKDIDTSTLTYICPTTVHPSVISEWKGRLIFFGQEDYKGSPKEQLLSKIAMPGCTRLFNRYFVGATMFQLANMLGASSIALVGYDFAYTDNKAYCDGFLERKIYDDTHTYGSPEWVERIAELKAQEVSKDFPVNIDGVHVYTTQLFQIYKRTLLELIFKSGKLLFNTTEGGILTEVTRMPLKAFCDSYCTQTITKVTDFRIKKR